MSIAAGADITAGRGAATHAASAAQFANNAIQAGNNATQSMSNATNRWFELWKQQDEQAARKQAMEIAEKEIGLKEKDQDLRSRAQDLDEYKWQTQKKEVETRANLNLAQAGLTIENRKGVALDKQAEHSPLQDMYLSDLLQNMRNGIPPTPTQKQEAINRLRNLNIPLPYDDKGRPSIDLYLEQQLNNQNQKIAFLEKSAQGIKGQYMQGENYAKSNQTPNELSADGGTYRFRNGNFTFSKNGQINFIKNPTPKQAQILAQLQNQQSAFTRE